MKVQPSAVPRCPSCYITRKKGYLMIRCKRTPKHNQRQGA